MVEEHWSTILANIVTSFGILSFIGFYLVHRQTQSQFRFTVMLSCIERFQNLFPIIRNDDGDLDRIKRYVDLTNEEFFYFQRGYIPKEVIVEWMDSIMDSFPVYVPGVELPINYDRLPFKQIHDEKLLEGYPRLMKAFHLRSSIDPSDHRVLIELVAKNLEFGLRNRHFKRAMLT